jgi:hypothetical protein
MGKFFQRSPPALALRRDSLRPKVACRAEAAEQRRLVEKPGVEPGTSILQGSTAARCLPRAWSWFRATLPAASARCFHQISLPGGLVRMPVIETGPDEWRSSARPSSYTRGSIFRKKACPGLDSGWTPTFRRKCDNSKSELVGSGRNRTSCPKGPRLQRGDGTSLSLPALPGSCRSVKSDRWVRTSLLKGARLFISVAYSRYLRGLQNFPLMCLNWRKREVLIPNGVAIHLASNERRTPARLRFPNLAEG